MSSTRLTKPRRFKNWLRKPRPRFKNWTSMFKTLVLVYGVPIGILVGTVTAARVELDTGSDGAATGIWYGFLSGAIGGVVIAAEETFRRFQYDCRQIANCSYSDWHKMVRAMNVKAAREHYLMVQAERDYVVYAPTLAHSIAGGPLTVSGGYLSIVVTRSNDNAMRIIGPKWIAKQFEIEARAATPVREAAERAEREKARGAADPPEQDARTADS